MSKRAQSWSNVFVARSQFDFGRYGAGLVDTTPCATGWPTAHRSRTPNLVDVRIGTSPRSPRAPRATRPHLGPPTPLRAPALPSAHSAAESPHESGSWGVCLPPRGGGRRGLEGGPRYLISGRIGGPAARISIGSWFARGRPQATIASECTSRSRVWTKTGAAGQLGTLKISILAAPGAGGTTFRPTPSLERPCRNERPSGTPPKKQLAGHCPGVRLATISFHALASTPGLGLPLSAVLPQVQTPRYAQLDWRYSATPAWMADGLQLLCVFAHSASGLNSTTGFKLSASRAAWLLVSDEVSTGFAKTADPCQHAL